MRPDPAGTAIGPFTPLGFGPHSLIAMFTPTDSTKFQLSTSNTVTFTSRSRQYPRRSRGECPDRDP